MITEKQLLGISLLVSEHFWKEHFLQSLFIIFVHVSFVHSIHKQGEIEKSLFLKAGEGYELNIIVWV